MRKGTTQNFVLNFKTTTDFIEKIVITFAQNGVVLLEKKENDCSFVENKVIVPLTQEETMSFDTNKVLEVQAKVLSVAGDVIATDVYYTTVGDIFNKELF